MVYTMADFLVIAVDMLKGYFIAFQMFLVIMGIILGGVFVKRMAVRLWKHQRGDAE